MARSMPSTTAAYMGRKLLAPIRRAMRLWRSSGERAGARLSGMSAYLARSSSGASSGVCGARKGMYKKNGRLASRAASQRSASSASSSVS